MQLPQRSTTWRTSSSGFSEKCEKYWKTPSSLLWLKEKINFNLPDNFPNIGGDQVSDELFHVVINGTSFFHSSHNCGEIVICQNHFRSSFGHCSTRTHGNSNFCFLQCRGIIDTITSLKGEFRVGNESVNKVSINIQIQKGIVHWVWFLDP